MKILFKMIEILDFNVSWIFQQCSKIFRSYRTAGHVMSEQNRKAALQIRSGQRSVTAKNPLVTAHIDHLMIIVTVCFSKKYFFMNITCTSYKLFSTILNLFSWNLNTFTKHKEQACFLFICLFFTHIKTLLLKILQYSRENASAKFSGTSVLKNIFVQLLLKWL